MLIRRLYGRDPLYSLLLTFGLAFMIEDGTRFIWGAQSLPYQVPGWLLRRLSSDYFFLTGYRLFMVVLVGVAVAGPVPDPRTGPGSASASAPERSISRPSRCWASTCACCAT